MKNLTYISFGVLKTGLILSLIFGLRPQTMAQQQMHLSQYALHQPFLNPASTAMIKNMNGALVYRHQWTGFEGAPKVAGVNFNVPFKNNEIS